jgi:hypothetical protein
MVKTQNSIGVTTLWWYAAPSSSLAEDASHSHNVEDIEATTESEIDDGIYGYDHNDQIVFGDGTAMAIESYEESNHDLGMIYREMKDGKQVPLGLWY